MLLTNYAIRNAGQSRALGGNLDPTYNFNLAKMNTFYAQDSSSLAPFQTNLVEKIGSFDFTPHTYTGSYTWLNGSGSGTNNPQLGYGWHNFNFGGTRSVVIDTAEKRSGTASLKLSTLAVASNVGVITKLTATGVYGAIPILPSTAYTLSVWVKTTLTSGSASTGAAVTVSQFDSSLTQVASTALASNIVTTTSWTQYTANVTTHASAVGMDITLRNNGSDGAATLIMDAWFDDLSITLTNQGTRSATDNNNQYSSQPQSGLRPPYSLVIAPKNGGMSMWNGGTGSVTGTGVQGLFGTADLTGYGEISNAAAGLIVEMVAVIAGLGGLTASVIGQLQASATLAGSGTITAAQSALAGMTATLLGTGLLSDAQQQALGEMTATIYVNQSEATVAQIVDAVWNAIAAEYNLTGTMGEAMNGAGSAGNPWITDLSSYNTANTAGKILKDRLSKNQFLGLK